MPNQSPTLVTNAITRVSSVKRRRVNGNVAGNVNVVTYRLMNHDALMSTIHHRRMCFSCVRIGSGGVENVSVIGLPWWNH